MGSLIARIMEVCEQVHRCWLARRRCTVGDVL